MDGKPEAEAEAEGMEWELLHHNPNTDDGDGLDLGPQLQDSALIRPDYFSLHPPTPVSSNSSSSTDPNEVDRNFDDSYVANQLFPQFFLSNTNHHHPSPSSSTSSNLNQSLSSDSDSDSDSDSGSDAKVIEVPHTTTTTTTTTTTSSSTELLDDAAAHRALDPKEEDEQEHIKDKEKEMVTEREEEEEEDERRVAWWKVPFEVFKYWVVRVSPLPAWSLSVAAAAAFLGLVILGRRLYKMKRKTQTLKLNVALDDKKVSQLMGRVARLNEAFSVVRRVPIVRPSLPAPSVTLRPVMSMR